MTTTDKNNPAANPALTPDALGDIDQAVRVLRAGGVIVYPTDTVWGLGCDATNARAVQRIYQIKQRDDSKALITLVADIAALQRTVDGIPDVAYDLIEYSERPMTIVYDRGVGVAPNLTAADGTLAVRVTAETFSQALCRRLGRPLVSTSANVSGQPTPAVFAEIDAAVLDAADYVCTTRRNDNQPHRSSTVMRLSADGQFKILRP